LNRGMPEPYDPEGAIESCSVGCERESLMMWPLDQARLGPI
jgi:hypothetical protein